MMAMCMSILEALPCLHVLLIGPNILMRGPPLPPPERPPLGVFGAALKLRNPTPGETLHSDKP